MIFGAPEDSKLKICILPLNNCFSSPKILQNAVKALSQMVFKNAVFCQKGHNFGPYDLVQISPRGPYTYRIMYGETFNFHYQHLQLQNGRLVMANLL